MEFPRKIWKKIKICCLCAGVLICLLTAVLARDSAEGGILKIVSAVLFDTMLFSTDGWPINLHAGGFEGFSMFGYYLEAECFLYGLAFTAISLLFLWLRPAKVSILLHVLAMAVTNFYVSIIAFFLGNIWQIILAMLIWALIIFYIVFICRHWRKIPHPVF